MKPWTVERHGGRATDQWRVVWSGSDETKASEQFRKRREKLRQGGLVMKDPEGFVRQITVGPRLRTRW